ncbi:hypothetical protein LEP1GSC173_2631 [Leptospira interrogans str. HAI1594]|uniref:Uncharacterized protein n=2 Tax=Leptospira interrogans TaxID=173 RepID=M6RM31_LEPIR|nr:hypothetical protein LEP1GSC117_4352 [Leptospira interrogans serovar Icterohaemorrhagiae str. Verdun LP]EKP76297.1 hypothetical protein LEP1GSC173_2631 [Leptospira interrogans str. HAI1594]EMG20845.1 hypothetical protein LEP1GSC150_0692 [Leptospira interrogans serovar Copenhageni str. LT2050]EMO06836.1 hypothetical protein LEP1GSC116_2756 [Leptospira interrogans serovar Icterohaemorrhagiae str. Verdun HP]EMO16185.1 hypothetical protein LEP1GSC167_1224 [Leptospira interrogans serovar Copenhag
MDFFNNSNEKAKIDSKIGKEKIEGICYLKKSIRFVLIL